MKTSNKKGSSLLIYKNNKNDESSDNEEHDYGTGNLGNVHTIVESNNEEEKSTESGDEDEEESTDDDDDNTTISEDDEYEVLQEDIVCSNHDKAAIPKSWILLDSQSTVDFFSNNKLITNIRESKCVLTLHCNASKVSVTQKGDLRGYGMVWYYPDGIANILSLYNVKKSTGLLSIVTMEPGLQCIRKMEVLVCSNPRKRGYSILMLKVTWFSLTQ